MTITIAGQPVHVIQKRDLVAMLEPFRDDAYAEVQIACKNEEANELRRQLFLGVGCIQALLKRIDAMATDEFEDVTDWISQNEDIEDVSDPESITGYINNVEKASTGEIVIHAIGE